MTLETTVSVTADHIDFGEPGEPGACPIALAIISACPTFDGTPVSAGVFVQRARLGIGSAHYMATLPQSAQDFIGRYDNALPVEPFEFTLQWEDES